MRSVRPLLLLIFCAGCTTLHVGHPYGKQWFVGHGQEPTWELRIDGTQLRWVTNYGIDTFHLKLSERNSVHRKNFDSFTDPVEDLRYVVRNKACHVSRDSGSYEISVYYNSREYSGCGQWTKKN